MSSENAAPCRHAGAPSESVVERTIETILSIANDDNFLMTKGITSIEYQAALPAAIEAMRGRKSANSAERRQFLASIIDEMHARGIVSNVEKPKYGDDTVYRLTVPGFGDGTSKLVARLVSEHIDDIASRDLSLALGR